jgi:uncharacterized alkaline shock family protein YloU
MDTVPTTATQGGPSSGLPGGDIDRDAPARTRGKTFIQDDVVSVIARIAAEQVPGVHQIGESSLRAIMARLGRHPGVDSEVGLQEAAVDVEIIVDFGYAIRQVAEELRARVIDTVESMTGRHVVEVNVFVVDVHVPKVERKPRRNLE